MAFSCAFDAGFDSGFEICPPSSTATVPTLRGVPPRTRKRPDLRDVSGSGSIAVIGAGRLTGETTAAGELRIASEGSATARREALAGVAGVVRTGAECVLAAERSVAGSLRVQPMAYVILAAETAVACDVVVPHLAVGRVARDARVVGLGPVRSGAEAVVRAEENEDAIIIAAAEFLRRHLTA